MVSGSTTTKPNMVKYLTRLTAKEKAVICFLANNCRGNGREWHLGLVPFMKVEDVVLWCKAVVGVDVQSDNFKMYRRTALGILSKMQEEFEAVTGTETFPMALDSAKVHRRFGLHPERGKPLPFLPKQKVTVGMKWSLPKKQWVDDKDVLVTPCVQLKKIGDSKMGRNLWSITVNVKCRAAVENWLAEHCSLTSWG